MPQLFSPIQAGRQQITYAVPCRTRQYGALIKHRVPLSIKYVKNEIDRWSSVRMQVNKFKAMRYAPQRNKKTWYREQASTQGSDHVLFIPL